MRLFAGYYAALQKRHESITTNTIGGLMANNRSFKNKMMVQKGFPTSNKNIVEYIATHYLSVKDTASLARTCQQLWKPLQPLLNTKKFQIFLQAVIDDDLPMVAKMLKTMPDLAKALPPKGMTIQSKYTWQQFVAEDALSMAVKRKQYDMITLLANHHDKSKQTLSKWQFYKELSNANVRYVSEKNPSNKKKSSICRYEMKSDMPVQEGFIIPAKYVAIIQKLIDVFKIEPFTGNKLSQKTQDALSQFRAILLPAHAVKLDDYFDIELLLYAACSMHDDQFNKFQNPKQRNSFSILAIGFIQSLVTPNMAKELCEGVCNMYEGIPEKYDPSEPLKLACGKLFYRSSQSSCSGMGFDFMCDAFGSSATSKHAPPPAGPPELEQLVKSMLSKGNKFLEFSLEITNAKKY